MFAFKLVRRGRVIRISVSGKLMYNCDSREETGDRYQTRCNSKLHSVKFKTEGCFCSNSPAEAMLLIKEVEMATSVDDLKKIIPNAYFKKGASLEEQKAQKADR